MSNTIKAFVRTSVASVTMATTVLGLGGFASVAPVLAVAPADFGLKEGDVIKASGDIDLYIVNQYGYKRLFTSPQIFNLYGHLGGFAAVKEVSPAARDAFMTSPFFRVSGDTKVWALEVTSEDAGCLHWVNVSEADAKAKYSDFSNMIFTINTLEPALYCTGADYTSMSQVQMYARGGSTPVVPGGPLEGGAGSLQNADFVSSLNNEDVGEGENNVQVAGLTLEADNGSDLRILSTKIIFDGTANSGSKKLDDFVDEVQVWLGSTKLATVDVADFNKDSTGVYSRSVSLADNKISMDGTAQLKVSVSAIDNLDAADFPTEDNWTVEFDSVRYVDAEGAITTEDTLDDIGATRGLNFVDYATSADLLLKLTEDTANHPDAQVVEVDDASATNGVLLFAGKLKAEGGDILVNGLIVNVATTGAAFAEIAENLVLEIDGSEVQSIDPASSDCTAATVTACDFDSVDYTINEGDTVTVQVFADINGTDDIGAAVQGSTLAVSLDNTGTNVDAEDQNGDAIATGDKSGSVVGNAQSFYSEGISAEITSITETKSGDTDEVGQFKFEFKVTAFGNDVSILASDSGTAAVCAGTTLGFAATETGTVQSCSISSTADYSVGHYVVLQDQTETFTVTWAMEGPSSSSFAKVDMTGINYDTTGINPATLTVTPADDWKSDSLFLL